jgi:phosphoglucosamine mutase
MRKYFGTDGIRGIANRHPMTPELSLRLGKALAEYLVPKHGRPKVLIGKDTRLSGYMIETSLTSGLVSMGCDVLLAGPMPTPAVAHLTKSMGAQAGIVISASHNPAEHNGIKIFDGEGYKLSDSAELEIESHMGDDNFNHRTFYGNNLGKAFRIDDASGRYIAFAKTFVDNLSLEGLKIVVDCANGAAYNVAPLIFSELGAETIVINNTPDGGNINLNCGAMHPEAVAGKVKEHKADAGIALDGDADRLVVCDEKGSVAGGDALLALFAKDAKERGMLKGNTLVSTVMSNLALDDAAESLGIKVIRSKVGDRYVIEEMRKGGYSLGGEQSGHIIFNDYSTTGDGILSALRLLAVMKKEGKPLSELTGIVKPYPQKLLNIPVKEKKELSEMKGLQEKLSRFQKELTGKGRILVRYSGTENIARVMAEAKDEEKVKEITEALADEIGKEVGL